MGGCAGKNKKHNSLKKHDENNQIKTKLEQNNNVSNDDHHSDEQTTNNQFNETNQVIDQILSSNILSISDSELEFELANLIYGHPEHDYAENPPIIKTFKSTEV